MSGTGIACSTILAYARAGTALSYGTIAAYARTIQWSVLTSRMLSSQLRFLRHLCHVDPAYMAGLGFQQRRKKRSSSRSARRQWRSELLSAYARATRCPAGKKMTKIAGKHAIFGGHAAIYGGHAVFLEGCLWL
eukprot:3941662-Rhodomonas_salina.2